MGRISSGTRRHVAEGSLRFGRSIAADRALQERHHAWRYGGVLDWQPDSRAVQRCPGSHGDHVRRVRHRVERSKGAVSVDSTTDSSSLLNWLCPSHMSIWSNEITARRERLGFAGMSRLVLSHRPGMAQFHR